jgi:heme/copper-type cytochrome/quinol oxidase subunit 1
VTPLVRRYIKTSFVFLLSGLLLGAVIIVTQLVLNVYPPRVHVTAHVHLLLVGFMLLIFMGVAAWTFPRPARDDVRYRAGLAEVVYWLMTVSTVTAPPPRSPAASPRRLRSGSALRSAGSAS